MAILAFCRPVPASLNACELTHLDRAPIDVDVARTEHAAYERALARAGCGIRHLPAADDQPDSVFVEDTAVVLDELAVIARPGAESRRGETASVAAVMSKYRPLRHLSAPATLDGGDVLRLGRALYVGVGARTNETGISQLADAVRPLGYSVHPVTIERCLHLKSAATEAAPGTVLLNPAWIDGRTFPGNGIIEVHPDEPFGANVLRIDGMVLSAAAHRHTNARLEAAGLSVCRVEMSELAKAEAGVTCCSLILDSLTV